ncbi:1-acyl-sn-glycerol-3-phosphate acyltransferase epsilon-like [Symsagittifera roscoffensis]|uniref:1-acyl-sn-glycerol-3-phosphate acyltransferase epsilon-like n=1 Tax=Symsagittifera roscoffensis TaxID=84072 RepID=UPI00307B4732
MRLVDAPRYIMALPMLGLAVLQCGAYSILWTSWRLVSLCLPSKYYPKGDDFLFERYQQLIIFIIESCAGAQLVLYGDGKEVLKKRENVIWLSNHQSAADWVVCEILALNQGSLAGVRYILKDTIKYMPIFGWYFPQHNCVYVRRTGTPRDIEDIERQLQVYPRLQMPVWLVIFPEGTRYNPDKPKVVEKSQQFAQKLNLPVLKHHLTPRVKAAFLSVQQLRNYADAVYDVTIGYEERYLPTNLAIRNSNISFTDFGMGFYKRVHVKVTRIDIKGAPETEEEFQTWLHDKFQQKDKDLDHFYNSDMGKARRFAGQSYLCPRSTFTTLQSVCFWAMSSAAILMTSPGAWLWNRSWAGILLGGTVYAVLKK